MSRWKGKQHERVTAQAFLAVDPIHPLVANIASSVGRIGHLDLGCDIATRRFAIECKNRQDISVRLWDWLDHIKTLTPDQVRVLVVRRNLRRPLVLLDLDDFLQLVQDSGELKPAGA